LLFKHDNAWEVHLRGFDSIFGHYDRILQTVSSLLISLSKVQARALVSATMDTSSCPLATVEFNNRIDANILKYEKEHHYGVAYVLLMQQMTRQPSLFDSNKSRFLRYRSAFFKDCLKFCERLDTEHNEGLRRFISVSQSYIPKEILPILPEKHKSFLLQWNAGDMDCLGRTLSHVTHDGTAPSHAHPRWQNNNYMQPDILGRIPIHMACLRADYKLFQQMNPGPEMLNVQCLGLKAPDIWSMQASKEGRRCGIVCTGPRAVDI
jgi:hypothetical protein